MIYHSKKENATEDGESKEPPGRTSVQPIMFMSKGLTLAETRYWPTELEVAGMV